MNQFEPCKLFAVVFNELEQKSEKHSVLVELLRNELLGKGVSQKMFAYLVWFLPPPEVFLVRRSVLHESPSPF